MIQIITLTGEATSPKLLFFYAYLLFDFKKNQISSFVINDLSLLFQSHASVMAFIFI